MRMDEYQSKPTRYHKINARSRTEARWATFFDAVSIPYTYEAEDTYLEYLKRRYLPDFYLRSPSGTVAVEVKGRKVPLDIEVEKCEKLCYQSEYSTLLLNGSPYFGDYQAQLFYTEYDMLQCKSCNKPLWFDEIVCSGCGGVDVGYYLASKVVRQCESRIEQMPRDDYLHLIHASGLPLAWAYRDNALQMGFRLASHAHYEYQDNWQPSLYDGDCVAFNPAFQTQDWAAGELLYNCFEGLVGRDWIEWWLRNSDSEVILWEYKWDFENLYYRFRNGGVPSCIQTYSQSIEGIKKCMEIADWFGADKSVLDAMDIYLNLFETHRNKLPLGFSLDCEIRESVLLLVAWLITSQVLDLYL